MNVDKYFNNMILPDNSKICPHCGGEMWQYIYEIVQCMNRFLWGHLPKGIDVNNNENVHT